MICRDHGGGDRLVIPKQAPGVGTPFWKRVSTGKIVVNDGRHYMEITHPIAEDGCVNPSVQCPHKGCPWHKTVALASWPG